MNRSIVVVASNVAPEPDDPEDTFRSFEGQGRTLAADFPNHDLNGFPEV